MISIIITNGPRAGERIDIDSELTVGREGADIVLDDTESSRRHAILRPLKDGLEVEDLGSLNGTHVAGQRISGPVKVLRGGTIRIGNTTLEVGVAGPASAATRLASTPGGEAAAGPVQERAAPTQPPATITLVISTGPRAGANITLKREMTVGRESADVDLKDDEASRRHAKLGPAGEQVRIEDLGSLNGTVVNGDRIARPVTVGDGSKLTIGATEITIHIGRPVYTPQGTRITPAWRVKERSVVRRIAHDMQRTAVGAQVFDLDPSVMAPETEAAQYADASGAPLFAGAPGAPPFAGAPGAPPFGVVPAAVPGRRKWLTLGAVSLGMFMMMLDVTVVNVALPTIQRSLGGSLDDIEWVVNGYALALAVMLLFGGKLADLVGRRLVFTTGLVVFTGASLMAGLAGTNSVLIAARLIQGCGAALVVPSSLSIITATFPPWERGTAIGIWSAVVGFGIAIGPLIGGLITEGINWNWIFFVNVPIGVAAVIAALLLIDESKDESPDQRLDPAGLISAAVSLGCLTYALIEGNRYGFGSTRIVALLVIAAAAMLCFLLLEARQKRPMLDLSLFRNRTFAGANATVLIMGFAMLGVFFFVSLYMQNVLHFSPIGAGAAFLPMTMLMMVIPPIAGRLSDQIGPRWLIVVGMCLFAIGLVLYSRLGVGSGFFQLLPAMLLAGAGLSLLFAPTTAAALSGVPIFKAGVASGVLNSIRQAGGSLGLAVMGAIVAHEANSALKQGKAAPNAFLEGYHTAMLVAAAVALLGALIAGLTIRTVKGAGFPGGPPGSGPPGSGPPGGFPGRPGAAGAPPGPPWQAPAGAPQPVGAPAGSPPWAPGGPPASAGPPQGGSPPASAGAPGAFPPTSSGGRGPGRRKTR